jgi:transposase InsO family protein
MFCSLFGFTKQAHYKCRTTSAHRSVQQRQARDAVLRIRRQMPRLGTRKLHFMLQEPFKAAGLKLGRDRLFDLLRREGLLVYKRRKYTVTTDSKHWMHKYTNRIKDLMVQRPEQLWVADITYLDTLDGAGYLHLVTDAYSKRIMGYELSDNLEAASTLKALTMAIDKRRYPHQPLIHHSDRGLQYCSRRYVDCLIENNIQISMTENGDPYENAVAERLNGILKDEFGLDQRRDDLAQAHRQTHQSIDLYNHLRPHLSCHYLTPEQMHRQQSLKIKTWKKKTPEIRLTPEVM